MCFIPLIVSRTQIKDKAMDIKAKAIKAQTIREQVKALETELSPLLDEIKSFMADQTVITLGDIVLILSEVTRTDLDKKALTVELGDAIKRFEKKTAYKKLEIKRA
jgi:predicted phage-related endonuclease